jgi:hypothetical protein
MPTVPLGHAAYKRLQAGAPEVRCENRWLEASPTNLKEHVMLLSRPGTTPLASFAANSGWTGAPMRGNFTKLGLFNGALFVTSGENFYRYDTSGTKTQITGVVGQNGYVVCTWMKGIGYEYLFVTDGLNLQFYAGPTPSSGTLTQSSPATSSDVIKIGTVYYSWNASVNTGTPAGTLGHPWLAKPGSDPMTALATMINGSGTPGVDYSTALTGPSTTVTATVQGGPPGTSVLIQSIATDGTGNSIATVVTSGSDVAFGAATLTNGGINALQGVAVPDGLGITALATVSGYVLAGVANSQKFFWINPGETTIDPLDFAEKESNPDNIVDMHTVGDQVLINGNGSTENWYATGNFTAPFAPVEGRVYARGAVAGTVMPVQDGVILVGDDSIVYQVGSSYGSGTNYGVTRISDHGIEERIRRQLRREQGLQP